MASSRVEELINYFKSHNKIREQQSHSAKVHSVGWSCDGKYLASGSFDKSVCIFSLCPDRLKQETTFRGHGGSVDQLCWHAFSPELLSTASGDKTVRIWDTRTQKCTANISTRGENINISWSPDGNTIAVGNKEDLVTFIDARVMKIRAEEQFNFEVNEISWNKDSDTFYLTNGQGCVHILSYPELELLHVIKAHPGTCICIEFDPTGQYFAIGSADALVSLWDADELCCLRTFSRLEWPVRTISFSYDGQLLAAASEDLVIDIGEVQTGEKIADVPVEAATFTVAWHPKQYLLAYACDDKDSYDRKRDAGSLKVYPRPCESRFVLSVRSSAGTSCSSLGSRPAFSDDIRLAMANRDETNTVCECRYVPDEDARETRGSFNDTRNIHEIDEEESETEETTALEQPSEPSPSATDEEGDKVVRKIKETSDDESVYTGESFCSDESCDESDVTNVTSRSLNSSSLIRVTDLQLSQSLEEQDIGVSESRWTDDQDESCSFSNEPSRAATADRDRFARSRRCRRWNMSFTDEEMRKIGWENELLLRKIMAQQKPRHKILGEDNVQSRASSSAINRKKLQKKIENDNVLLQRRIQQAKSCVFANTSRMGCRLTFL